VAAEAVVQECPFEAMPLTEVAELILRECRPMTPVELVVAFQEPGHRTDANPRQLVATLRNSVKRYPGRFAVEQDGRWTLQVARNGG
jgi:hypothetical protein